MIQSTPPTAEWQIRRAWLEGALQGTTIRAETAESELAEAQSHACRMHYLGNLIRSRSQEEQDELTRLMRKYPPRVLPTNPTETVGITGAWKALAHANGVAFRDAHDQLDRTESELATERSITSEYTKLTKALKTELEDARVKTGNQRRVLSGQAVQLEELKAELAAERARVAELTDAINIDHTGLAAGLSHVVAVVNGYQWIADGSWGSYDYTQRTVETLQREVGHLINGARGAVARALKASGKRATKAVRSPQQPAPQPDHCKSCGGSGQAAASGDCLGCDGTGRAVVVSVWSAAPDSCDEAYDCKCGDCKCGDCKRKLTQELGLTNTVSPGAATGHRFTGQTPQEQWIERCALCGCGWGARNLQPCVELER